MRRWQRGKNGKRKSHVDAFGRKLKSGLEVKVSEALGKDWLYEEDQLPYVLNNVYHPDFTRRKPGRGVAQFIHIEVKGGFTGTDRRKMKAVKAAHPDVDIRLVFMRAGNKLNKKSKTTYGDWATKNGFPWSQFPKLPL